MKKVYAGKWTLALTFILLGGSILWNMYAAPKIVIADFYPLVLVLLGMEIIIKALTKKGRKVSLEAGSIILLVLVMIFVNLMPFTFLGPRSDDLFSEDHPVGAFFRELSQGNVVINFDGIGSFNTTYEIEETFSVEDIDALKLENAFGNITLESWQGEEIKVLIQIQSDTDDQEYVEGLKEALLSSETEENTLLLASNNRRYLEDSRVNSLRMNYQIFIPEGEAFSLFEIVNEFGDVKVAEIESGLRVNNRHGDVKIVDAGNFVEVENHFGDVTLGAINGEVKIMNRHGDVTLENEQEILTELTIENEFGSVHLQLFEEQPGVFDLRTGFGDINQNLILAEGGFEETRGSNEQRFQGTVGTGGGHISIQNRHGDITIEIHR